MVDEPHVIRGITKLRDAELKAIVKSAIKEWLDEQINLFGKWSLRTLFAAGLAAGVYFILLANGWSHK